MIRRVIPAGLLLGALCLLLSVDAVLAQAPGQVRVVLRRPPPNQLRVADMWQLELFNSSDQTFTAYAHGTATEATDGLIVDATSAKFRIPPGRTVLNGEILQPITINESNPDYRAEVLRTGAVRSGDYRVCVEVFTVADDMLLGEDCYDQVVENQVPPILISPIDNTVVTDRPVVFTWMPPTPVRSGMIPQYQLQIVEVLGRQSPYDAMASNPAFFETQNLTRTVFPYPIVGARGFDTTRTYAWRITAYQSGRGGRDYIIGTSEVAPFRVGTASATNPIVPETPTVRFPSGPGEHLIPPISGSGELTLKNTTLLDPDVLTVGLLPPYRLIDVDKLTIAPKIPTSVLQELLRHCNE